MKRLPFVGGFFYAVCPLNSGKSCDQFSVNHVKMQDVDYHLFI